MESPFPFICAKSLAHPPPPHAPICESRARTAYSPTTLVVFELQEVKGGTLLTVTESGFDRIPLARRAQAFTANDGG